MTRDEIAQALRIYADAKSRHALDEALDLVTEDSVYEDHAFGSEYIGKEALRQFYGQLWTDLPDYFGDFDGHAYGENVSVSWGRWGGTLGDTFMGVSIDAGRRLEIPVTFVCYWRQGLLARDVGYFDSATLLRQAGLAPEVDRRASESATEAVQPSPELF